MKSRNFMRQIACRACLFSLFTALHVMNIASAEVRGGALELVLESDRAQLVIGEPLYVAVRLINRGSEPVSVFHNLDPELGWIRIEILGPKGQFSFAPWSVADSDASPRPLAPNSEANAYFPIFFGGRGWTFDAPGDYTVTAVYNGVRDQRDSAIRSNALKFEVARDPAGEFLIADQAGGEAGKFMMWQQGDHLRRGVARLQELTAKFPKSRLASYAYLAQGVNLSRSFKDYSIDRVRAPQCEQAQALLSRIRSEDLPASSQVEHRLAEARCYRTSGKPQEVDAAVQAARDLAGRRAYLLRRINEEAARLNAGSKGQRD